MKLYFRILMLPTKTNSRPQAGKDNVPMINKKGELWFLWNGGLLSSDLPHFEKDKYKLKRLT